MKTAIQLYNFRNELKADYEGTLRRVAELGYDGVEFAMNYGGIEPEKLAELLRELKLECAGTMFKPEELLDPAGVAYRYAEALNSPAVTISLMHPDFVVAEAETLALLRRLGDAAAKHPGVVFSYHNHWREFVEVDGAPVMYRLLDATDPQRVYWEPDVCWITRGGGSPAAALRRYGQRILQVHLKDIEVLDDNKTTTELGRGVIDLAAARAALAETRCLWQIVEQDNTRLSPFESAAIGLRYLRG